MKNIKAYFALLTTVAVLGCFAISSPAYAEKDTGSNQPEQQIIQQTTQAPSTENSAASPSDEGTNHSTGITGTQDFSSEQSLNAGNSIFAEAKSNKTSASKILQPGNRYYTNVTETHESGLTPGLYLVSAVSTGYSSHFSINDATGNYNSISDAYVVEKDKPQKIEVKDGYFVHIFEGSGLCASSWELLKAYPRNANDPVLYPGSERTLINGSYSATAPENSTQHIEAGNYLVKAIKETSHLEIKDFYGNTMEMFQAPYATTYVGGYESHGWIQVQIPANGSVIIHGPIGETSTSAWVKLNTYQTPQLKRLAGNTRYDTMTAVISEGNWETDGTVIVASGNNYPDALAASGLAGTANAPIVLTESSKLSAQAADQLQRLTPSRIIVVGGPAAVSNNVFSSLQRYSHNVNRISGATRVETSFELYRKSSGWGSTAIIATSTNYADALSVSSYAYAAKAPVFLCDPANGLTPSQKTTLKSFSKVLVVGGENAVPSQYVSGVPGIVRKSGNTRYDTSAEIAKWTVNNGLSMNGTVYATGMNFPDALAAGPLAGKSKAVTLLVDGANSPAIPFSANYKDKVGNAYVVGGINAVNQDTANAIADSLGLRHAQ